MCLKTSAVSRLHLELYLALEHVEPLKLESLMMIVSLFTFVDIYRLDSEARCLCKIETRGAVECGVPSVARALPTCREGFNFT